MHLRHPFFGPSLLMLLALLPAFGWQPACAQWRQGAAPQVKEVDGAKFSRFTIPADIPDVPMFTGKCKLESGDSKETQEGTAYVQSFSTTEPLDRVLPWYETALANNQWRIVRKSQTLLSARKGDGSYCSVSVQSPLADQRQEARCIFEISYFKANPHHKAN